MNKDMIIGSLFCENHACTNNVGYAGALVENPTTHQRVLCCQDCLKQWYVGWVVLLRWK